MARTSTGSRTPLRVSARGSETLNRVWPGLLENVGGDQDLLARCRAPDAGRDVHAPAAVVTAIPRRLGRVQTDPHRGREPVLAAVARQPPLDVDRALDRLGSLVERHEEAVAGAVDFLAAMACEGRPKLSVVPRQELRPGLVADEPDEVGRGDDVGEHERPGDSLR